MSSKLLIKTRCLKDLLILFDKEQVFHNLIFCDTWHPSSGFIDETIFQGKTQVNDILNFDYEFEGLVGFEAEIGEIKIRLLTYPKKDGEFEEYEFSASGVYLRSIYNKIIEQNVYHPNKYYFQYIQEWQ